MNADEAARRAVDEARALAGRALLDQAAEALHGVPDRLRTPRWFGTLAAVERDRCRVDEARDAFAEGIARCAPGDPFATLLRVRRAVVLPPIATSRAGIEADRARMAAELDALASDPDLVPIPSVDLLPRSLGDFYLVYHGLDDRPLREALVGVMRRACPALTVTAKHCGEPEGRSHGPLRLGVVSSHFRDHTILRLQWGVLERLARDPRLDVEPFFVDGVVDADGCALCRVLGSDPERMPGAGPFEHLSGLRDAVARARLDVVLFPDVGMDLATWWLAFSRLAPLQCVGWGHPVTTGSDAVDCFLSTPLLDPPGNEALYTESLVRLPDPAVCAERPPDPERGATPEARQVLRENLGLPTGGGARLYVCPQNLFKFHPDFDRVLVEILERDPAGCLVLSRPRFPDWVAHWLSRLRRTGLVAADEARIHWVGPLPRPRYLDLMACADVVLDPVHFGGGQTSLEAFGVGAPIVSWPSQQLRGRLTMAWAETLQVRDGLVARLADFAPAAVGMARDPERNARTRRRLLDAAPRLFENGRSADVLADFLARTLGRG